MNLNDYKKELEKRVMSKKYSCKDYYLVNKNERKLICDDVQNIIDNALVYKKDDSVVMIGHDDLNNGLIQLYIVLSSDLRHLENVPYAFLKKHIIENKYKQISYNE